MITELNEALQRRVAMSRRVVDALDGLAGTTSGSVSTADSRVLHAFTEAAAAPNTVTIMPSEERRLDDVLPMYRASWELNAIARTDEDAARILQAVRAELSGDARSKGFVQAGAGAGFTHWQQCEGDSQPVYLDDQAVWIRSLTFTVIYTSHKE